MDRSFQRLILKTSPRLFGQPAELATAYVMLADPLSSYVSGATIAVTGGRPML
jgi:NAD(P)-dependent dehydrogenase (short-subunit alcohol dehydrogenase family)